jgi:hypothetical protein
MTNRDTTNRDQALELARSFLDGTMDEMRVQQFCETLHAGGTAMFALVQTALFDESLTSQFEKHRQEEIRSHLLTLLRLDDSVVRQETRSAASHLSFFPDVLKSRGLWLMAASIAIVACSLYFYVPHNIAMVTQLIDARMLNDASLHVGARLQQGQRLEVAEGVVEVTYDQGTVVSIKGPADFQLLSDMRATSLGGRITVDVGKHSSGFTVETPSANIVDWGTEFGVGVAGDETDIVVFDGTVDLHARGSSGSLKDAKRMNQGDALRVGRGGELQRIVSVNDAEFPNPRLGNAVARSTPIIASVKDNVRDGTMNKCYRVVLGGLMDDALAYVDRDHQWNGLTADGLPRFLMGADYVMPFNEDKRVPRLQVSVTFARDAVAYVFYDGRIAPAKWLLTAFEDTGVEIGLDEGPSKTLPNWTTGKGGGQSIDTHFRVWKRVVNGGETIQLGPRGDDELGSAVPAMYGIAATAIDNQWISPRAKILNKK